MKSLPAIVRATLTIIAICFVLPAAAPAAVLPQDVVTVDTVFGRNVVDVPVYIRDVSGTPLGIDQPPGSRIQGYSIKVNYAPASAVQSITFTRAGITSSLTPLFESSPSAPGTVSLLDSFSESTNLIPFTLNAPAPGNQIAHLTVTLAPGVAVGTVITFTLDPTLTQLTDQSGSGATAETTTNGRLALVNGSITVLPPIPVFGSWTLALLAVALAAIALRMRA